MATAAGSTKAPATAKYDAIVAGQLARAEARVRSIDLAAALLGFAAWALAFTVFMVLLDSKLDLGPKARQAALFGFLGVSAAYLWLTVVQTWRRPINPYYAALKVEALVPGAKNSVVNWVDLHGRELPPAIRGALGQRAARDVGKAEVERAINAKRAAWAAGIAAVVFLGFLVAIVRLGPGPFFSRLARTFGPFGTDGAVATRTQLAIVRPEGGDVTVAVGKPVTFTVEVGGKVPDPRSSDALRLQYRYEEGEHYLERFLRPDAGSEWTTTIPGDDVRNGFWYRIAGGDAVTREHRVSVRAAPFVTDFWATYHFRPYVSRIDEVRKERELKELRGTEVTLRARTNRIVQAARLEWEGATPKTIPARVVTNDPQVFEVKLVLDESGKYRLAFTSAEGEPWSDATAFEVTAIADEPPEIEMTRPAQDVKLPANGLLQVEGHARDDIGVKSVLLRTRVIGGDKLKGKPYRGEDGLRLAEGGYPQEVDYKDFLDLAKVQDENGKAVKLQPGMELEYWLEASDACDYDRPNVKDSKRYKITIIAPDNDAARQQQERKKAEEEQKQHQQEQDKKFEEENKARQEERKRQEQENKEKQKEEEQAKKDQKPEGNKESPETKQDDGKGENEPKKPEGGDNEPRKQDGNAGENDAKDKETQKKADDLKKALEKNDPNKGDNQQGEAKPDQGQGPGEAKGDNQQGDGKKPDDKGGQGDNKPDGDSKDAGKDGAQQAGEGKEQGKPDNMGGGNPSEGKDGGKPDSMMGGQGEAKDDKGGDGMGGMGDKGGKSEDKPVGNDGKGGGRPDGKQGDRSENKPGGNPDGQKQAGEGKPEGNNPGTPQDGHKGEGKEGKGADGTQGAAGEKKGEPGSSAKGEGKNEGSSPGASQGSGSAKGGGGAGGAGGGSDKAAESKPQGGKDEARAEGKPSGGNDGPAPQDATPNDVARQMEKAGNGDDKGREAAEQRLEQIKDQAKDPAARQAARDALEKMGDGQAGHPGENKGAHGGDASPMKGGDAAGQVKEGKGDPANKPGDAKQGDGKQGDNKGDNKGPGKPGDGDKGVPGQVKGPGKRPGVGDPGKGRPGSEVGRSPDGGSLDKGGKPARPDQHRASAMQLDDFKKRVNKDVLKDAKMSDEDYRRFLKAYEDMLKRQKDRSARAENVPESQPVGRLPSIAGGNSRTGEIKPGDDLGSEGRALPPPQYRDPYREFTKQMARPGK